MPVKICQPRGGAAVKLATPQRGTRARILDLAQENAREAFRLRFRHPRRDAERFAAAIAATLGLAAPVGRIECFDVSHTQGEAQVASLVVMPLTVRHRTVGVLVATRAAGAPAGEAELAVAQLFCDQASLALRQCAG